MSSFGNLPAPVACINLVSDALIRKKTHLLTVCQDLNGAREADSTDSYIMAHNPQKFNIHRESLPLQRQITGTALYLQRGRMGTKISLPLL